MAITVVVPERDGGSADEIATAVEACQSAVSECQSYAALLESVDTQNAIELTTRISTEEVARASDDTSLTSRISTEEATRGTADTSLTTRLSSEEVVRASADTSLTTRLSAEETTRASADTSLTTRLSAEEVARASADTSLTSRVSTVEAGYLPTSGGVLTGALRVIAGVALAVGLAVGADAGTGLYAPASQQLGIAAGGQNVATFEAGIATVAGVVKPDADATRDLGTVSARWRDAFLSRDLYLGQIQLRGQGASSFIQNAQYNTLEAGLTTGVLMGGNATYGNLIGSTGLPTGPDWTPSGWSADSGYVAGSATVAQILGGHDNIVNQTAGIIVGGGHNFVKYNAGGHSVIVGGSYQVNQGQYCFIGGGRRNTIIGNSSAFSFIGGAEDVNIVGSWSGVASGSDIDITGDYSFAAGAGHRVGARSFITGNNVSAASYNGVTAFTDSTLTTLTVGAHDVFVARFANGYRLIGGKVAIGATDWTPSRQLEVRGGVALSNADDTGAFYFLAGASVNSLYSRAGHSSSTPIALDVYMGSSRALTLTTTNRLGVGTNSPVALLEVAGTFVARPGGSAPSLTVNGQVTWELTSDTTLTFKARGSDGVTRSGAVTLA